MAHAAESVRVEQEMTRGKTIITLTQDNYPIQDQECAPIPDVEGGLDLIVFNDLGTQLNENVGDY